MRQNNRVTWGADVWGLRGGGAGGTNYENARGGSLDIFDKYPKRYQSFIPLAGLNRFSASTFATLKLVKQHGLCELSGTQVVSLVMSSIIYFW